MWWCHVGVLQTLITLIDCLYPIYFHYSNHSKIFRKFTQFISTFWKQKIIMVYVNGELFQLLTKWNKKYFVKTAKNNTHYWSNFRTGTDYLTSCKTITCIGRSFKPQKGFGDICLQHCSLLRVLLPVKKSFFKMNIAEYHKALWPESMHVCRAATTESLLKYCRLFNVRSIC